MALNVPVLKWRLSKGFDTFLKASIEQAVCVTFLRDWIDNYRELCLRKRVLSNETDSVLFSYITLWSSAAPE